MRLHGRNVAMMTETCMCCMCTNFGVPDSGLLSVIEED